MLESSTRPYADRLQAGRALGERLRALSLEDPVVLGLARGGVPVAAEVARALDAPLDVLVVRKLGAPGNPELGVGAIAEGGACVINHDVVRRLMLSSEELEAAVARAGAELQTRVRRYRQGRPPLELTDRTAVIVDDGLATGGTARAALRAVRARSPRRLVLAVPVGAEQTVRSLRQEADEVVCLIEPEPLIAVGCWYDHFAPTDDAEITALLAGDPREDPDPPRQPPESREVEIPVAGILGDLVVPPGAQALVIFAHGSGSSRFSPRNRQVAQALQQRHLATLLLDLLRPTEELDRTNVFDIRLLAERLRRVIHWVRTQPGLSTPGGVGLFGASTGAAAALQAAATLGDEVGAVVSRGGRPDLAGAALATVRAPVLLIVGSRDEMVLELNREARAHMPGPCELAIIPGATHLFNEPGALEEVAALSGDWFERHLTAVGEPAS